MLREEVIRRIVDRDIKREPLCEDAVMVDEPELSAAAVELFGTWNTALHYAGINTRRLVSASKLSRQDVLRTIRYLCCCGYHLGTDHNLRRDRRLYDAARYYFGTWRRALSAAGINLANVHQAVNGVFLSETQIIEAIRKRHDAGLAMRWMAVCLDDRKLANSAKSRFHSWRRALSAAGIVLPPSPP